MLPPPALSNHFDDQSVLITGGTGSFGQAMTQYLIQHSRARRIIIFSRDECKQWQMQQQEKFRDSRLRFFLGDVRDRERLTRAFRGVDIVIHAAALKQVPAAEYNPTEFIKTNINGTLHVTEAAIESKVGKVLFLSTDKAVNPLNLYGATKLCAEKLVLAAAVYGNSEHATRFSVLRYGNVMMSRGSVIELWKRQLDEGATTLNLTDPEMTRFWITLQQATYYVHRSLEDMRGGEIFIPRIPSMRLIELARIIAPNAHLNISGIRPGEKLHEVLMNSTESPNAYQQTERYIVIPDLQGADYLANTRNWWAQHSERATPGICFASNENCEYLSASAMSKLLDQLPTL